MKISNVLGDNFCTLIGLQNVNLAVQFVPVMSTIALPALTRVMVPMVQVARVSIIQLDVMFNGLEIQHLTNMVFFVLIYIYI